MMWGRTRIIRLIPRNIIQAKPLGGTRKDDSALLRFLRAKPNIGLSSRPKWYKGSKRHFGRLAGGTG